MQTGSLCRPKTQQLTPPRGGAAARLGATEVSDGKAVNETFRSGGSNSSLSTAASSQEIETVSGARRLGHALSAQSLGKGSKFSQLSRSDSAPYQRIRSEAPPPEREERFLNGLRPLWHLPTLEKGRGVHRDASSRLFPNLPSADTGHALKAFFERHAHPEGLSPRFLHEHDAAWAAKRPAAQRWDPFLAGMRLEAERSERQLQLEQPKRWIFREGEWNWLTAPSRTPKQAPSTLVDAELQGKHAVIMHTEKYGTCVVSCNKEFVTTAPLHPGDFRLTFDTEHKTTDLHGMPFPRARPAQEVSRSLADEPKETEEHHGAVHLISKRVTPAGNDDGLYGVPSVNSAAGRRQRRLGYP